MKSNKKQIIEVREFQRIYYKKTKGKTKEDREFDYKQLSNAYVCIGKDEQYNELSNYIREYNSTDNSTADPIEFLKIVQDKELPSREAIIAKNYVGLIQLKSGTQIQILPKIVLSSDDNNNEITKKIFMRMLMCLPELPGKFSGSADLEIIKTKSIYEFFIRMFAKETLRLVNRGLRSGYVPQEDNLHFFKGKLKVNEHIKYNSAHKERFYVQYDEFVQNRPENRLIKSTLMKLLRATSDMDNSKLISRLLTDFDDVEPSVNYARDMASVSLDRNISDYAVVMKWVSIFLFDKSFTTFSGSTDSKALLFPMERIFEAYVAKEVRRKFVPDGWDVTVNTEESRKRNYLFYDMTEDPKNPHGIFKLEPDIVLRKDDSKKIVIMDTKWKRLVPERQDKNGRLINYGISQSDMYQMYAYSVRYMQKNKLEIPPEVWVLYPKSDELPSDKILKFESKPEVNGVDERLNVKVHAFFIDLENIQTSLDELAKNITQTDEFHEDT